MLTTGEQAAKFYFKNNYYDTGVFFDNNNEKYPNYYFYTSLDKFALYKSNN